MPLCYGQINSVLQDSTLTEIFNESELADLNFLLDFFDKHVCEEMNVDASNLSDAYQNYFAKLLERSNASYFYISIPFEQQLIAYGKIDTSTFKEIWLRGKIFKHNRIDSLGRIETTELESINLNYNGKYYRFLKKLSSDYKLIEWYCESFDVMGAMSPWMVQNLLVNYKDYNTNDIRIRLFAAIHYLTLNDQHRRNEK